MHYVVLFLAAYYISAVLTRTDGYKGIIFKLRRNEALPFYCLVCTAVWAGLAVFLLDKYVYVINIILAIAGSVVVLNDVTQRLE